MTVTLNLPPDIERAFLDEAEAKGLPLDEFLRDILVSQARNEHGRRSTSAVHASARLATEAGVPVLCAGEPIDLDVVDETLDAIRRERDTTSSWETR